MELSYAAEICRAAAAAEREAASLMLHARGILAETKSGRRDVVTEYDRRVQETLTVRLREAAPEARFFCEETENHGRPDEGRVFIVDPIDGTMNFVHGFHRSSLSVAFAEDGEVWAGAIYNPYLDELFTAVRGQGAFLNGRPIRVAEEGLADSIVCIGTAPYVPAYNEETFRMARRLFEASLDIRREGSAALDLCSVAAGRAGLFFEMSVCLWDYAAGALLVREAGGLCLRPDGTALPVNGEKTGIVAASPACMREFGRL